ncbi:MAG: glycosyltransferase [Bacteroidia bacterium]|nr:glycosyltransferase [Bacteroidia bacterium]
MKVLYVFLDGTKSQGVINKVKAKINYLNQSGIETAGLFFNANITERSSSEGGRITYVPAQIKPLSKLYKRRGIRKWYLWFHYRSYNSQFYSQLEAEVAKHDFDLILLRYPLASKGLLSFVRKYKGRIIFEHNSKEIVELGLALNEQPSMKYYIEAEQRYGTKVLSCAAGITAVGNELLKYELSRVSDRKVPGCVVSNSFDVSRVQIRRKPIYDGNKLKLLFVTGSPSPWVGIDLLLKGLAAYRGPVDVSVRIAGPVSEKLKTLVEQTGTASKVELAGELGGKELDSCYDEAHIAIGTLAMQRVGLNEHSSLKVLEYAARGIPFVIGYHETNFPEGCAVSDSFLNVGYNGETVDVAEIVRFAERVLQQENVSDSLRKWAEQNFNSEVKMKTLRDFILSVHGKQTT